MAWRTQPGRNRRRSAHASPCAGGWCRRRLILGHRLRQALPVRPVATEVAPIRKSLPLRGRMPWLRRSARCCVRPPRGGRSGRRGHWRGGPRRRAHRRCGCHAPGRCPARASARRNCCTGPSPRAPTPVRLRPMPARIALACRGTAAWLSLCAFLTTDVVMGGVGGNAGSHAVVERDAAADGLGCSSRSGRFDECRCTRLQG